MYNHVVVTLIAGKGVFACPTYHSLALFALTDVVSFFVRVWSYHPVFPSEKFPLLRRVFQSLRAALVWGKPAPHCFVPARQYRGLDMLETLAPTYMYVALLAFYLIQTYSYPDCPIAGYWFPSGEKSVYYALIMILLEFVQDKISETTVSRATSQEFASIFVGLRNKPMHLLHFVSMFQCWCILTGWFGYF